MVQFRSSKEPRSSDNRFENSPKKKKNLPAMQETQARPLGWENSLEKGMATHSRILAWRIPWIEQPGGLQSIGHKESDLTEHADTSLLSITERLLLLNYPGAF